jgi:hypothetical protein
MAELSPDFQSMPEEYQHLIRLVQERYKISVAPLQLLVGGWSGASTKSAKRSLFQNSRRVYNARSETSQRAADGVIEMKRCHAQRPER